MDEILSVPEVEQRYDSEWVLLEVADTGIPFKSQRGRVLWHSKDRDEVYRKLRELQPKRCALIYTGTMPQGTAIVL